MAESWNYGTSPGSSRWSREVADSWIPRADRAQGNSGWIAAITRGKPKQAAEAACMPWTDPPTASGARRGIRYREAYLARTERPVISPRDYNHLEACAWTLYHTPPRSQSTRGTLRVSAPPQVRVETHAEWSAHRHSPGTKTPRRSFK